MAERESTDLLDVSSYEGGNMLNSEIFRTTDVRRQSANLGMREGKAFGQRYSLEQGPCRFGFHVPTDDEREEVIDIIETLELTENIHETLLLPKSGKKQNLSSVLEGGEKGYYLSRNPNNDGTANVFAPSESTPSMLQMAIRNAISVRGFRNRPIVPTTAWTKMGGGIVRLPYAYQELEWIESNGSQWIDTLVTPTSNTTVQFKFMPKGWSGWTVLGYYTGNDNTDWRFFTSYGSTSAIYTDHPGRPVFDFNSSRVEGADNTFTLNTIYELEMGNYYLKYLNGSNILTGSQISGFTGTTTIKLDYSYSTGTNASSRWYYIKIYDGGELIKELVPCYRVADGMIGLYDIVNGFFYENKGSGYYLGGPEINIPRMPGGYTQLGYIQSTGTQYIDTGLKTGIGYKVHFSFFTTDSSVLDQTIIGGSTNTSNEAIYFGLNYNSNHKSIYRGYNSSWFDADNTIEVSKYYEAESIIRDGNQKLLLNGSLLYSASTSLSGVGTENMTIFRRRNSSSEFARINLFGLSIYDKDDVLVRNFMPCIRESDSAVGLYDFVTKTFYSNIGTGEFGSGGRIVRASYVPSEDTIAYYPLKLGTNISDQSGHGYDLTNGGMVSFGTNYGVNCGNFSSGGTGSGNAGLYRTNSDIVSFGNNYTWLVWLYKGSESMSYNPRIVGAYNGAIFTYAALNKISVADSTSYGIEPSNGEWFLFTATYDGTTFKFYKNGVYQNSASYSRGTSPTTGIVVGTRDNLGTGYGDKWSGGMSEIIIEKRLWEDSEIISYFNYVKKRYGLI